MKSSKQYYSLLSPPASPCSVCFLISLSLLLPSASLSSPLFLSPTYPSLAFSWVFFLSMSPTLLPYLQYALVWDSAVFLTPQVQNKTLLLHFIIHENAADKRIAQTWTHIRVGCWHYLTHFPLRHKRNGGKTELNILANGLLLHKKCVLTRHRHARVVAVTANVLMSADCCV